MNKPKQTRTLVRRKPKTARGEDAQSAVLRAAQKLLSERNSSAIPIVELAERAGIARASLLLQFPGGWPEILNTLAVQEIDFLDTAYEELLAAKGMRRDEKAYRLLEALLARAESTGRLYPNLRAAMFTWGEDNQGIYRCGLDDMVAMIATLLRSATDGSETAERTFGYFGESLLHLAWDLASFEGLWMRTWTERRAALRHAVTAALLALKT